MRRAPQGRIRGAWAWLAWAAMLMLLAQPATAAVMAGPVQGETLVVELCSAHSGGKAVTVELPGAPAQKSDCEKCVHCFAPPSVVAAQPPLAEIAPTAYAVLAFVAADPQSRPPARAPPRPPSQGPPAPHA